NRDDDGVEVVIEHKGATQQLVRVVEDEDVAAAGRVFGKRARTAVRADTVGRIVFGFGKQDFEGQLRRVEGRAANRRQRGQSQYVAQYCGFQRKAQRDCKVVVSERYPGSGSAIGFNDTVDRAVGNQATDGV